MSELKYIIKPLARKLKFLKTYIEKAIINHSLTAFESKYIGDKLIQEELTSSILNMKLNRMSGKDGLTIQLYRLFFTKTKEHSLESLYNTSYDKFTISETTKIGIIVVD